MTDRDVDAAVEQLRIAAQHIRHLPLDEFPDSRQDLANWIEAGCEALAEAQQQNEQLSDELERVVRCTDECERIRAEMEQQLAAQAQEIAKLKQEASEHLDYMSQASTAVREIQGAQREQDAQQLDNAAAELDGTSRVNSNIARILHEEAAKMRAARTPQEPIGVED